MINLKRKEATTKEELCKHCMRSDSYRGNAGIEEAPHLLKWMFRCTHKGKAIHAQTNVYYCSAFKGAFWR